MFIISYFSFHALLRCTVSDPFLWLTDEKRAWFHKTLLLLYLLVVHHYCFTVHIGVLEVCLSDEFTFLGNNTLDWIRNPTFYNSSVISRNSADACFAQYSYC